MKYYEDIEIGDTMEFGEYHVTEAEIVDFAESYDPQPFHIDKEAATESAFGELVASGWHTASMCMRLLADGPIDDRASMGARGVDELRWKRPVKPGDTLSIRTEVIDKRVSESDPKRGYVDSRLEGLNQHGEVVISWIGLGMIERRNSDENAE
ncbi:MaoC domain protein [Natrialba magadii ATCC 43099]|uniref:MaoC domain protein n=1 Tax=Natrialba magadii (strain ATCC 43099 / DSM 3394 / CCM 3739 / CIP 104546 / IAM 13178 / JCM 8861 / NBRC 102185 / NCIMB 2190 / MS3) TaxID=547559 RepID=D3SXB9_NATMM|nr:MaoC family dehydratase [Natrialba magadii]ADD03939.1 MaoC domain protein [Natrialba magadii ATCC 43099]ELY33602.1 MaoC domain-containing protein dehydratase [Natrialba magadii ATCC 43099]